MDKNTPRKQPWLAFLLALLTIFCLAQGKIILAVLCALPGLALLLFNPNPSLEIDEEGIRIGRFHCGFHEIAFVYPQLNMLTILLKNGKSRVFAKQDSWEVADDLRRRIFALETESPDVLRRELDQVQESRKKLLEQTIIGCILMFTNIFLGAILTGGRETEQFIPRDWVFISIAAAAEVVTVIWTFVMASRCGKTMLPIAHLHFRLRSAVIAAAPRNHALRVYTDTDFRWLLTVQGFPQDEGVYCIEESIGMDFRLEHFHTTKIYSTLDDIPDEFFEGLIDIT